ncbi:MAG: hypothetical protein IK025_05045 [Bacteroidales bacterium]|nr:hypothetical protein [Bacteroidales bacterium]
MSQTITNEIKKAEVLASGLKSHIDDVKKLGITADGIKKMEEVMDALRKKDEEVDAMRKEISLKGREKSKLLSDLKSQMLTFRKAVKQRYLQPEWLKYGVQDKR